MFYFGANTEKIEFQLLKQSMSLMLYILPKIPYSFRTQRVMVNYLGLTVFPTGELSQFRAWRGPRVPIILYGIHPSGTMIPVTGFFKANEFDYF